MALYGVYGSHTVEACPVNHRGTAKTLVEFVEADPTPSLKKYKIQKVLCGTYAQFGSKRHKSPFTFFRITQVSL